MPIDTSNIQAFTSQDQLNLWLRASAQLAVSETYRMNDGRLLTRANAAEVIGMISFWEARVQLEANGPNGNVALVQFGDPAGRGNRNCF